jgi:hypothetical protein
MTDAWLTVLTGVFELGVNSCIAVILGVNRKMMGGLTVFFFLEANILTI